MAQEQGQGQNGASSTLLACVGTFARSQVPFFLFHRSHLTHDAVAKELQLASNVPPPEGLAADAMIPFCFVAAAAPSRQAVGILLYALSMPYGRIRYLYRITAPKNAESKAER